MDSQNYLEITVKVPSEDTAEIIEAVVSDLGFDSFAYEDGQLRCYIQAPLFDENSFKEIIDDLAGNMEIELSYSVEQMPAVNWNAEWEKSGFTPIVVGSEVTIMPAGSIAETPISIELDPQMAFGTGHHHTTCMMMETMLALREEIKGSSVMDLGCGTAVLAILAAKLGAVKVSGIDIDAVAARSAENNVRMNGFDFGILCGDANDLQEDSYDFLLANIHRNIIINDLPLYSKAVRNGGKLLLSGFYSADIPDITTAAATCGFELVEPIRSREDWACLQLTKVQDRN